jgi:hypothetical protein
VTERDLFGVGFVLVGFGAMLGAKRCASEYFALADDYRRRWPFQILPRWYVLGQWIFVGTLFVVFGALLLTAWRPGP